MCVSAVVYSSEGFDNMEVDEQDREQVDSERESGCAREKKKTTRTDNERSNM